MNDKITPTFEESADFEPTEFDISQHSAEEVIQVTKEEVSETAEWVDGLPPIGVECEVRYRKAGGWVYWAAGMFKAGFDSKMWFKYGGKEYVNPAHDIEFRPKQPTPEQIEADKRKEIVEDMRRDIGGLMDVEDVNIICYRAYDWLLKNKQLTDK
jgi:hypothetical protein